jgi:hypothetical protein
MTELCDYNDTNFHTLEEQLFRLHIFTNFYGDAFDFHTYDECKEGINHMQLLRASFTIIL